MQRILPKLKGRPCRKPFRSQAARNRLAEENVRLVTWAVSRFRRGLERSVTNAYPFNDAEGDAWTGFLRACELWEPSKGALSGYAWNWMWQAMNLGLQSALNMIRSPGRKPEERIHCILKECWMEQDAPADQGEGVVVTACRTNVLESLEAALERIDPQQAAVIRMRLTGSTWSDIAKRLKTSVFKVRGIEEGAREALYRELEGLEDLV